MFGTEREFEKRPDDCPSELWAAIYGLIQRPTEFLQENPELYKDLKELRRGASSKKRRGKGRLVSYPRRIAKSEVIQLLLLREQADLSRYKTEAQRLIHKLLAGAEISPGVRWRDLRRALREPKRTKRSRR